MAQQRAAVPARWRGGRRARRGRTPNRPPTRSGRHVDDPAPGALDGSEEGRVRRDVQTIPSPGCGEVVDRRRRRPASRRPARAVDRRRVASRTGRPSARRTAPAAASDRSPASAGSRRPSPPRATSASRIAGATGKSMSATHAASRPSMLAHLVPGRPRTSSSDRSSVTVGHGSCPGHSSGGVAELDEAVAASSTAPPSAAPARRSAICSPSSAHTWHVFRFAPHDLFALTRRHRTRLAHGLAPASTTCTGWRPAPSPAAAPSCACSRAARRTARGPDG